MAQPASWYNPLRFCNLAYHGLKATPAIPHQKNIVEKAGDGILYVPEHLPRTVKQIATNPQIIVISLCASALLTNSYLHYPEATIAAVTATAAYLGLREITWEQVKKVGKFSTWSIGNILIMGASARAGGRLTESYIRQLDARPS